MTTIKEYHEELEILLPLLAFSQDVKVLRLNYYNTVTDSLYTALQRRSAQERMQIAQTLQQTHTQNASTARQEVVIVALQLIQLLATIQVVRGSQRLLGAEAPYRKSREVIQLQASTVMRDWKELADYVSGNPYFKQPLRGVPSKIILPAKVSLQIPDIIQQLSRKPQPLQVSGSHIEEVTLLKVQVGHDTVLGITALATFSEHGLPKLSAPRRGFTARCILRNAQDQRMRQLAEEEEQAAMQLNEDGQPVQPNSPGNPDPVGHYASLHSKLYEGSQRPYLLRVFVRLDGTLHIPLLRNSKQRQGLYVWGIEVSRSLAQLDIEMFLEALKDADQKVPRRTF